MLVLLCILPDDMYNRFFNLKQAPFSIAPDPRYLFMSERHREALAHLLYGVNSGGGFVLLTGEIGAGKTTICRCFLGKIPADCNVAYIFNPKLTVDELLQSICEEFHIPLEKNPSRTATVKAYVDRLTEFMLAAHAKKQNNVLIIDEAQNLSLDVLEQLRLLTNLETDEHKLLQIVLIGQPELRDMLTRPDMEQLAQRVIARYHLAPLSEDETAYYIMHRLAVAGNAPVPPFSPRQMKRIYRLTRGVPRRINLVCDRALLGAYAEGKHQADDHIISKAAREVLGTKPARRRGTQRRQWRWRYAAAGALALTVVGGTAAWAIRHGETPTRKAAAVAGPITRAARLPAAVPIAQAIPVRMLNETHATTTDEREEGLRGLARLWGVTLKDGPACEQAPSHGLHCYDGDIVDMYDVKEFDRPILLPLRIGPNNERYAILTALDDRNARLLFDGTPVSMTPGEFEQRAQSGFITFWRMPTGFRETVGPGASGADVDWIAAQLARLHGEPLPEAGRRYDEKMAERVRQFQATHGVEADGIVGAHTFMQFNRIAGMAEPSLRRSSAASIAKE